MKSYMLIEKGNWYKLALLLNTIFFILVCLILAYILYKGVI
jgi:hypothetical protein